MSFSSAAVEAEAFRRFNEEQNAARALALEAARRAEAERLRLIEAQREDRVRRESEQIQARLRAEDAEREARRVAEQEAFDTAVKQQVAALKSRPLEERLRLEIEELRHAISCLSTKVSCAPPVPQLPSGYSEMQAQLTALSSSPWSKTMEELKAFATLPARKVHLLASPHMLGASIVTQSVPTGCTGGFGQAQHIQAYVSQASNLNRLHVNYQFVRQDSDICSHSSPFVFTVGMNHIHTIEVPVGMRVNIVSAKWDNGMDVTLHLKATGIESQ